MRSTIKPRNRRTAPAKAPQTGDRKYTRRTRTISFQPLERVGAILERIRRKRGLKFTSSLINEAIVRHFAGEMTETERTTGEISEFLAPTRN